ncbi:MAG: thioredoxin [Gemmatimonadetes bacterium]|nr:thioredoxin [Gemmatimonadota bacterium]
MTTSNDTTATAVVACPFCQTLNRVALGRLDDRPTCGECRKPLLLDRPLKATDASFEAIIQGASVPVVVDFYADWCGPCRLMAPTLDQFASDRAGSVLVVKLDTDASPATPSRFGIRGIPTLLVFSGGKEVARHVGVAPLHELARIVDGATSAG